MKLLITGGAGFIGSNFIKLILEKYPNYEIINFDKLTYCGNLDNLKDISDNSNYTFIKGDICDQETVTKAINGCDVVIHFAAESHVDNSIKDPYIFTKTNVFGTHVLLECARKSEIKKFIHISTDEVYGSINQGSFHEDSPLKPNSPYSASKAGAEVLARSYYETYKVPIIITRSSNNFGPNQYPEKIIPLFITNLFDGKKVPVYGNGLNVRDWIYVIDNCEAIDFVMHHGEIGEVYNIGGGNEKTNLEITNSLIKETGRDESFIEFVKDRLGHDQRYSLNSEKINKLGWKPRFSFDQALKETVKWYQKNRLIEKNKKIIVIGANGMLGSDLISIIPAISFPKTLFDITDDGSYNQLNQLNPDIIINCAAYTAVDNAENDKDKCSKVNTEGVRKLVEYCKNKNIILVQISTDYVFDGEKNGYDEDDKKNPLNFYGKTKADAEDIITSNLTNYYIIRTSWLFGKNGSNFIKKIFKLSNEREELKIVYDQIGSPTYTKDLANAIYKLIKLEKNFGIYHITNSGTCSWFEFAKEILAQEKSKCTLIPISLNEYITPAKRPKYSVLLNHKFDELRSWKEALNDYLLKEAL